MIQIGKDIRIDSTEFKGKEYVVIRRYYNDNGEMKPGRQGINLKREEWQEICDRFEEIKEHVKEQ